jgi:signal transduction histidine kinase
MRERALLIGSRLEVAPAEGGGTDVRLHVPTQP